MFLEILINTKQKTHINTYKLHHYMGAPMMMQDDKGMKIIVLVNEVRVKFKLFKVIKLPSVINILN